MAGLAVMLLRGGSLRPGRLAAGARGRAAHRRRGDLPRPAGTSNAFVAPGAVAGALLLLIGPWVWQLAGERTERIRAGGAGRGGRAGARLGPADPRTRPAARRRPDARRGARPAPGAGASPLALRQRRRRAATLLDALERAAADVEELHGVRIELASAGDVPLDERARSARARGPRGDDERGEVLRRRRDRGLCGAADGGRRVRPRRGAASTAPPSPPTGAGSSDSIEGRMARAAAPPTTYAPGSGTEVELRLPGGGQ